MTFDEYVEILRLFDEDPEQLIDKKIELEFNEVEGRAILFDEVAAVTTFEAFQFTQGPHAGKKLFCKVDYSESEGTNGWTYDVNVNNDGFLFNWDPSIDVSKMGGEIVGGDYLPELSGVRLTLSNGSK